MFTQEFNGYMRAVGLDIKITGKISASLNVKCYIIKSTNFKTDDILTNFKDEDDPIIYSVWRLLDILKNEYPNQLVFLTAKEKINLYLELVYKQISILPLSDDLGILPYPIAEELKEAIPKKYKSIYTDYIVTASVYLADQTSCWSGDQNWW